MTNYFIYKYNAKLTETGFESLLAEDIALDIPN